jgi:predicted TIM-barrel fold metal-dependent hydrolase
MKPSDYFRRQCYVSVEEAEPVLDAVVAAYPQSVVFASDYPHGDGKFPGAPKELLDAPVLDDATRRAVLHDNACRLYSL